MTRQGLHSHIGSLYCNWRWRTGRKVGRTIYAIRDDEPSDRDPLIGTMDSRELAQAAVDAHNAALEKQQETER